MTDILKRLRIILPGQSEGQTRLEEEAAQKIELLTSLLSRYRDETPLGNQPHMIAHLVDDALGRVPN
jgi:hypothetical protein